MTQRQWFDLTVSLRPPAAYWKGEWIEGLTATEVAVLYCMALHGAASYDQLDACLRDGSCTHALRVHVSKLRSKFSELGIPMTFTAEERLGYRLTLPVKEPT